MRTPPLEACSPLSVLAEHEATSEETNDLVQCGMELDTIRTRPSFQPKHSHGDTCWCMTRQCEVPNGSVKIFVLHYTGSTYRRLVQYRLALLLACSTLRHQMRSADVEIVNCHNNNSDT